MSRILIAEDEERLAAFIEKGLRKSGFDAEVAYDGEQAIYMAQSGQFDLLLLDLGLPIKDGWAVLSELRESKPNVPVIIVTARDDERDKATGLRQGAKDYVTKPFSFKDLLQRIRDCLNS